MAIMPNSLSPGSDGTGGAILPTQRVYNTKNFSALLSLPGVNRQPLHVDTINAGIRILWPLTAIIPIPRDLVLNNVLIFSTYALHLGAENPDQPLPRSFHFYQI